MSTPVSASTRASQNGDASMLEGTSHKSIQDFNKEFETAKLSLETVKLLSKPPPLPVPTFPQYAVNVTTTNPGQPNVPLQDIFSVKSTDPGQRFTAKISDTNIGEANANNMDPTKQSGNDISYRAARGDFRLKDGAGNASALLRSNTGNGEDYFLGKIGNSRFNVMGGISGTPGGDPKNTALTAGVTLPVGSTAAINVRAVEKNPFGGRGTPGDLNVTAVVQDGKSLEFNGSQIQGHAELGVVLDSPKGQPSTLGIVANYNALPNGGGSINAQLGPGRYYNVYFDNTIKMGNGKLHLQPYDENGTVGVYANYERPLK